MLRDFRLALQPLAEPKLPKVVWIDDVDQAHDAIMDMSKMITEIPGVLIASDIETRGSEAGGEKNRTGLAHTADIVCAGFSIRSERAVVFGEKVLADRDTFLLMAAELWDRQDARYLWHNGKYDVKNLRLKGVDARVDEDTMLLSWCLDERPGDPESGAGGHSLEWLLKDELGWPKYEPASVRHFKKTGELPDQRARVDLYEYNGFDTAGSLALFEVLQARAINDGVWDKPYRSMLIRLSEAFTRVELQGNLYDVDRACDLLEYEVYPKLIEQKATMRKIAHKPKLNPNSPKQLETLLYDEWGVTHDLMRPKIERLGKRSTDKWVREALLLGLYFAPEQNKTSINAFIQQLDDFKGLDTQRSRYLEGLVLKRFPNGRIYTEFKIHGTESGRVSSANPNLQNILFGQSPPGAEVTVPNLCAVLNP
jgi:DNA polymerase I-like protein with 3'-5' exonuclease and polymerase domains